MSHNPSISHYRRAHAPNRLYLSFELNAVQLWKDYCSKSVAAERVCYETYRKELRRLNVSFAKLGTEECDICLNFANSHKPEHTEFLTDCSLCAEHQIHLEMAQEGRHEYGIDREESKTEQSSKTFVSADLMKVLLLPVIPGSKRCIFTPRLVTFNETFAALGPQSKQDSFAFVWHEAEAGRPASVIADVFFNFILLHRDSSEVVIWTDNCCAQNKNFTLFRMMISAINSDMVSTDTITLKFLEPGHTFMSADSLHHLFEERIRKRSNIFDFDDLMSVFMSTKNVTVKHHQVRDLRQWTDESSIAKRSKADHPILHDLRVIQFRRGSRSFFYKLRHSQMQFQEFDFLKKNARTEVPQSGLQEPRGIARSKIDTICDSLLNSMPVNRRSFWLALKSQANDRPDLLTARDDNE